MGYVRIDTRIYDYLNRGKVSRGKIMRNLSCEEMEWIDLLRKRGRELNALIVELITIRQLLRKMNEPKLFYISENLNRIMFSLKKQRDFAVALKNTIFSVEPYPQEIPLIKDFMTRVETRINYLRNSIIPENLELTPIKEYLEIMGVKDFTEDIYRRFGSRMNMYDANTERNDELEQYMMDILLTVHNRGLDDKYKERLSKYIEQEDKRLTQKKLEKKQEKLDKDISLAKDGMDAFQRMFHKGIRSLKGCSTIKMGWQSVEKKLDEYGRDAYVILCCYVFNGKCVYRYVGEDHDLTNTFFKAKAFKEGFEATDIMAELEKKYPEKVFDVVKLDYAIWEEESVYA